MPALPRRFAIASTTPAGLKNISPDDKRIMFLLCLAARAVLAYTVYNLSEDALVRVAPLLSIPAAGFMMLYFGKLRMRASEASGGVTWWADFRLLHGAMYACAAVYAHQGKRLAALPLFVDVLLGAAFFVQRLNESPRL